jgi:hypothetical protein
MSESRSLTERYRSGRNLLTPHPAEAYPGLRVVRPGPQWSASLIVPADGQTVIGRGGERVLAYVTPSGVRAAGFELRAGDEARMVQWDLPSSLVEWEVARAPRA